MTGIGQEQKVRLAGSIGQRCHSGLVPAALLVGTMPPQRSIKVDKDELVLFAI